MRAGLCKQEVPYSAGAPIVAHGRPDYHPGPRIGSDRVSKDQICGNAITGYRRPQGQTGLLITLQRTTLEIALMGAAAAVVGFIATLVTGDDTYTYRAGLVAVAVLLYCYPIRTAWQRAVERYSPDQNASDLAKNRS